ncbi:MAG: lycopene cyclase domain-containing protein, partial [Calditrichota bacterium]
WWFNPRFTTGIVIAGLPVEEILFFISVPFACLFVWEVFFASHRQPIMFTYHIPEILTAASLLAGGLFLLMGHSYTGIVWLAFGSVLGLDQILQIRLLQERQTYYYLGIVTLFILIFNGYLTARPLVLYDESYLLGLRIFTIPVEDFIYGYALILFSVILYEKFRRGRHG